MGALLSIKKKLKPLGLYNLEDQNIIDAEIAAYAVGIDQINQKLEELERECFISTAETYGLEMREKLFDYAKNTLDTPKRREMLLYRMAITANDFTKKKLEEALRVSGMDAYIVENKGGSNIEINCQELFDNLSTEEQAIKVAKEFLPAHLVATFDFRDLTWNKIEENDLTFNNMDAADLTWNQIDS